MVRLGFVMGRGLGWVRWRLSPPFLPFLARFWLIRRCRLRCRLRLYLIGRRLRWVPCRLCLWFECVGFCSLLGVVGRACRLLCGIRCSFIIGCFALSDTVVRVVQFPVGCC